MPPCVLKDQGGVNSFILTLDTDPGSIFHCGQVAVATMLPAPARTCIRVPTHGAHNIRTEVLMKALLVFAFLFAVAAGPALAQYQHISEGPPGDPIYLPFRDEVCQYGFQDDLISYGSTIGMGQQLGIECREAGCVSAVGFYSEFILSPGDLDIVIYDDGVEVSRTTIQSANVAVGVNDFDIDDVAIVGDACIMLCAVDDENGIHAVTGEDMTNGPFDSSYWSNSCTCENEAGYNYMIWATICGAVPAEQLSWGTLRTMYR